MPLLWIRSLLALVLPDVHLGDAKFQTNYAATIDKSEHAVMVLDWVGWHD